MKPYEVDPPDKYKTGKERCYYEKMCYRKAYEYFVDVKPEGGVLVHGVYTDIKFGHAWVELPGDIVFDGAYQRFYKKDDYYREQQAEKRVEFSTQYLVAKELLERESYGPWFEEGNKVYR